MPQGIDDYGKWCGGGHGGFQDCCNGGPCSQCDYNVGLTQACLNQCPPVDSLDAVCAQHDLCCYQNDIPSGLSCTPQGNYCKCDCILVRDAANADCSGWGCNAYRESLEILFKSGLSCWYYDNSGKPVCNSQTGKSCTEFC